MRDSEIGCFSSSAVSQANMMDELHTFRPNSKSLIQRVENKQTNDIDKMIDNCFNSKIDSW